MKLRTFFIALFLTCFLVACSVTVDTPPNQNPSDSTAPEATDASEASDSSDPTEVTDTTDPSNPTDTSNPPDPSDTTTPGDDPPDPPDPNLPTGEVEIHFIDVGQGDAVLLLGTEGQSVLYDGGRNNTDVVAYLDALGITSLDVVIASHPDSDHIGGLDVVVEKYQPRFFMDNTMVATTNVYEDLLQAVAAAGSEVLEPTRREIKLGNATLEIIPPPPASTGFDRNNRSIGVLLDFGDFEASLTGDMESKGFEWWQTNTPDYLQEVEVYKSAHHGSDNGDDEASMSVWSPKVVVIGVSATNAFGHPTEEALNLYASVNAVIYRTDLDGDVMVTASSDGQYSVSTTKE